VKVLLDEQLSDLIAQLLRKRGLDAQAIVERTDLLETPDHEVIETASREDRAVVTNNVKDFRPLAAKRITDGRGHAGLILHPAARDRSRDATGRLADAIEAVMRANSKGIPDAELWLAPLDELAPLG
jgi:hypothetical protein